VLSRQPEPVQRFLEDSSVLEELDLEACRAVTGVAESARLLRELSAENALIMPSGDGYTYRYHRLFRDLLQFRLRAESPERFAALHETAAAWYASQREYDRAAAHLTSAGDDDGAYAVLRDHAYTMLLNGGPSALNQVVTALDIRRADEPGRAVDIGVALAIAGANDEAERWLTRVNDSDAALSPVEAARLAAGRAMLAAMRGDETECEAAVAEMHRLDVRDPVVAGASVLSVMARLWLDDPAGARTEYASVFARPDLELVTHEVMLPAFLVSIAAIEGELREAEQLAHRILARAESYDLHDHPMNASALIGRALVRHERGELDAAELDLERAARLAEPSRPPIALSARVALARVCLAGGRHLEAEEMLATARALLPRRSTSPLLDIVTACEARLALARGDLDRADSLIRSLPSSERRIRLTATMALARGRATDALAEIERATPVTKRQRFDTALLRARALHMLAHADADAALVATIALAREEGFVVALVDDLPELAPRVSYHLRTVTIGPFEQAALDRIDRPRASAAAPDVVDLVEKLTPREQTILRYLSSRLTIKEIATECYVSPNTVKSQAQAVYRKLGVSSRREATAEGHRLRLI
jgi:LuxR family maltose regulon positive regulatory protein